jgi:hypothetical protein
MRASPFAPARVYRSDVVLSPRPPVRRMSSSNPRAARIAALVALAIAAGAGIAAFRIWQQRPDGAGAAREGTPKGARSGLPGSLFAMDPYFDPAEPPATVEGLVVGSDVLPLDGATVALIRLYRRNQSAATEPAGTERPGDVARTSGSGRFRFEQVVAGTYLLAAMADGRAPICVGPVALAPGETKTQTIRLLQPGAITLTGHVLAANDTTAKPGTPVGGAKVRAIEARPDRGPDDKLARIFQTVADEAGKYEMYLDAGTYAIAAEADGHVPARDWLILTRDETVDLHLAPPSRVVGKVVERGSSRPIPDADLWVLPQRPGVAAPHDVHSDRIGFFAFNQIGPGSYRIGARKERQAGMSGPISLQAGQSITDVVVELAPGQAIAGRVVTMTGAPVPGASIELVKAHPPFERPLVAATGSDGRFLLEGLLPAQFRLVVTAAGLAGSSQQLRLTGDLPSLEIRLHPEATVRGRVLTADHRPADGANVNLQVAPAPGSAAAVREFTITGADGTFTAGGLPSGELTVRAQHPLHGLAVSRGQKLAEAEPKSISLALDPGSSVAGTVKDQTGAAIPGVVVHISETAAGPPLWTDVTQAGGIFRLTGLPAGHFILDAAGVDQPRPLTVDGRTPRIGLALIVSRAAAISGVLLTSDGQPVPAAEITVQPESTRGPRDLLPAARTFSGPDGRFTLTPPTPGKQTLSATSPEHPDLRAEGIAAGTTDLQLRFATNATCSGVVFGPDGQPLPHYTITLLDPPPAKSAADSHRTAPSATDTVHDPAGRFSFTRVAPGPHELRVTTAGGATASLAITVRAGEQKQGLRLVIGRDVAR